MEGEEGVEPLEAFLEETDYKTNEYHGHEGADADYVPLPSSPEDEAEDDGECDKGGVDDDFDLAKLAVEDLCYGNLESFARHHDGVTTDLAGYAEAHGDASCDDETESPNETIGTRTGFEGRG